MKNKFLLMLSLTFMCFGCNNTSISESSESSDFNSESFSNESSSINNSSIIETQSSSLLSSNEQISSNESSEQIIQTHTIKQIKEIASNYTSMKNDVGVYESSIEINIDLKLLACLDAITSKSGYGDRYKVLMSDGIDYIYVKTNFNNYDYLKNYVNDQSTYNINGTISLYNDEVEITNSIKPTYLPNKIIEMDYNTLAKNQSLNEIYADLNKLTLNCKGVAFSKIIKTEVICLAKDINNTNMYFANNDKIINVHGHDKVTNKFSVGNSYTLYGALSMHNFRPSLEYVYHTSLDKQVPFDTSNLKTITASSFYNYKYEVDKNPAYPEYSKFFENAYIIEGYANLYIKDSKEYVVFEDSYNENIYQKYENAATKKAVFFVNENYIKLTSSNSSYCPLYEYALSATKVKIIVFPYLWNTQKYFQVYCYDLKVGV